MEHAKKLLALLLAALLALGLSAPAMAEEGPAETAVITEQASGPLAAEDDDDDSILPKESYPFIMGLGFLALSPIIGALFGFLGLIAGALAPAALTLIGGGLIAFPLFLITFGLGAIVIVPIWALFGLLSILAMPVSAAAGGLIGLIPGLASAAGGLGFTIMGAIGLAPTVIDFVTALAEDIGEFIEKIPGYYRQAVDFFESIPGALKTATDFILSLPGIVRDFFMSLFFPPDTEDPEDPEEPGEPGEPGDPEEPEVPEEPIENPSAVIEELPEFPLDGLFA